MTKRAVFIVLVAAATIVLIGAGRAWARDPGTQPLTYHTDASLVCSGCHTMHYSQGGAPPAGSDPGGPFPSLLLRRNATDLCLNCHGSGGTAPNVVTGNWPGGIFPTTLANQGRGHNPFGTPTFPSTQIPEDSVLHLTPPGGTGALNSFTCGSCHSTHGFTDYVNGNSRTFPYRILQKSIRGAGGVSVDVSTTIISTFADEQYSEVESATNHNVYRAPATIGDASRGFSKWCASCHTNFHEDAPGFGNRHPTSEGLGSLYTNYTRANPADSYAGGTYHYKYPVETNQGALATTATQWPIPSGSTERVFCLSCHRAHGSNYGDAGRWDFTAPSGSNTGCNKCHSRGN